MQVQSWTLWLEMSKSLWKLASTRSKLRKPTFGIIRMLIILTMICLWIGMCSTEMRTNSEGSSTPTLRRSTHKDTSIFSEEPKTTPPTALDPSPSKPSGEPSPTTQAVQDASQPTKPKTTTYSWATTAILTQSNSKECPQSATQSPTTTISRKWHQRCTTRWLTLPMGQIQPVRCSSWWARKIVRLFQE